MSAAALLRGPEPLPPGLTWITRAGESDGDTGMDFGLLRLAAGESADLTTPLEQAVVLLGGSLTLRWSGGERAAARRSLLDEVPTVLHTGGGEAVTVVAASPCELAVVRTAAERAVTARLFDGSTLAETEHRGRGRLDDTAYRLVRTVFDERNRGGAQLVLGEVVNFPGRWSSYPPHHHPQPEIYHYRFEPENGYGHGELGDEVFKVRHRDTLKIAAGRDHAQVAAPGYAMWYLWVIRHLPGQRYTVPEFTEEHRWTLEPDARPWRPASAGRAGGEGAR